MKLHNIFALFLALVLTCCSSQPPKPKPFLNEKKMVSLLIDMHLTEALIQQMQPSLYEFGDTRSFTTAAYAEVFDKYGLTKETFEENYYYHTHHSRNLVRIYEKVDEHLRRMDSLNKEQE